mgnify:CR=1
MIGNDRALFAVQSGRYHQVDLLQTTHSQSWKLNLSGNLRIQYGPISMQGLTYQTITRTTCIIIIPRAISNQFTGLDNLLLCCFGLGEGI